MTSIFKIFRRSNFWVALVTSITSNLMIFAQPLEQMIIVSLNNKQIDKSIKKVSNFNKKNVSYQQELIEFLSQNSLLKNNNTSLTQVASNKKQNIIENQSVTPNFKETNENHLSFPALEKSGTIGIDGIYNSESPIDNFFTVYIPENVNIQSYDAILSYELFGLNNASQTTKIINNSLSYGGQLITSNNLWQRVNEFIPIEKLNTGHNEVFFTRRGDEIYYYQIKNLRIDLVEKKDSPLIISENLLLNLQGNIYFSGFTNANIPEIEVNGKIVTVHNGVFECYLENVPEHTNSIQINYRTQDGELKTVNFPVLYENKPSSFSFPESNNHINSKKFFIENNQVFQYQSLGVEIEDYSKGFLTVEMLTFKDLKDLNSDIYNVTLGDFPGYRIKKNEVADSLPVKLYLAFDPSKIPDGYTASDVRTFYFDRDYRNWKMLSVDSLDLENNIIISTIFNETDFINGVINVPESPETGSFTPTMMTEMEYANPAAGIVSISTPNINNTGSLATSFPIKLPAGRNGMQPSLQVSYNSEGGNGWMGIGWDLSTPAITLNTKWGAPLFDNAKETEMYLLNGAELVMNVGDTIYTGTHRIEEVSRQSNREFYLRVEGGYSKVVRHGSSPANYWWEVTDKMGNKSFYGGKGSITENAVIRTGGITSNIAHWALYRTEDPYGNYVEYEYDKPTATIGSSSINAQGFYIKEIRYTLKSGVSNYYKVEFKRNAYTVSEPGGGTGFTTRKDITVNGRNGFLQITKDLLTEIHVSLVEGSAQRIRTYRFDYYPPEDVPFRKTLLKKIAEFDTEGVLFYSNTMEYFDEIEGNDIIDTENDPEIWGGTNDDFSSPILDLAGFGGINSNDIPNGSPLGTSNSTGFSFGLRTGFGLGKNITSVSNTIGGSFNYSRNAQNTTTFLIDINGDNLPDKVFKNGGSVYYRPNTGSGFGNLIPVSGINDLSKSISKTNGWGVDVNAFGVVGIGTSRSKTKSETDHYFVDFNGDGLPDMASGGKMRFNVSNGYPFARLFTDNVGESENEIISGAIDNSLIEYLNVETLDEVRENHPQYDHVQLWRAPYTGTINIDSEAIYRVKNANNSDNHYRLTIEKKGYNQTTGSAAVLETKQLTTASQSVSLDKTGLSVTKGDVIFFRTHNLDYGSGGTVEWNPVITYTGTSAGIHNGTDEHGKDRDTFSIENDFMLNNGSGYDPGDNNSLTLNFNLNTLDFPAYQYSDDIRFVVTQLRVDTETNEIEVEQEWVRTYDHLEGDISGNNSYNITLNTPQDHKDSFYFEVQSDSNVVWDEINWTPTVVANGATHYPEINYVIYDENVNQSRYWVGELPQPVIIDPEDDGTDDLIIVSHNFIEDETFNEVFLNNAMENEDFPVEINWVVKGKNIENTKTYYKRTFYLQRSGGPLYIYSFSQDREGTMSVTTADSEFVLSKNQVDSLEVLYAAFYIDNKFVAYGNDAEIEFRLTPGEESNYSWAPVILNSPFWSVSPALFGLTYRGWGQFLYNGALRFDRDEEDEIIINSNSPQLYGDNPIDIAALDFESEAEDMEDIDPDTDPEDVEDNGKTSRFTLYSQDTENKLYRNSAIIEAVFGFNSNDELQITTGRFGEGNLYNIYMDPMQIGGTFQAIKQRTVSKGKAVTGNLFSATGTDSNATSDVLNQYIDLNGDRYPDLITSGKIQYTNSLGGLSEVVKSNNFNAGNKNKDEYIGISVAAYKPNSTEGSTTSAAANGSPTPEAVAAAPPQAASSNTTNNNVSAGIGAGGGSTYDSRMFLDMNGDGLPDKVTVTDDSIEVWLNTGYGFTDQKIVWGSGYSDLTISTRQNANAGPSVSISESLAFGFGAGFSDAEVKTSLMDVNGDGLPDLVMRQSGKFFYYQNTGIGFDSTLAVFYENNIINKDVSLAGNAYGSFTFGFVLFSIGAVSFKLVFSPTAGINASTSETKATVQDINGDGLPDVLLKANNENNSAITAKLNQIGKTHLLKKVNNPLGGSWEVDYTRDGNTYDMPQSKWVVTTIKTHDGFIQDNDFGPDETLTTVVYENPKHDRRERDFLGYEKVTVEQRHPGNSGLFRYTLKEYHIDNIYLKGAEKAVSLYSNTNELLSRTETLYNILDPDSPVVNMNADENNHYLQSSISADLLDHSRLFVAVARTRNITYEDGMALVAVQEFTEYDDFGNLLKVISYGDGTADTFRSEISYYDVDEILSFGPGFPETIEVYQHSTHTLMRKRTADYNNYGKLSEIVTKLNDTEDNTVELKYDSYGNLTEVHYIDSEDGYSNHYVQEIGYDTTLYTYPVAFENSFGHTSTTEYNYLFGIPVFTTDLNGNSMRTRIDNRGRIIEVTGPNELDLEGLIGNTNPAWTIRMEYKGEDLVSEVVGDLASNEYMAEAEGSFPAIDPGDDQPDNAQHYAVTRHFDAFYADPYSTETTNQLLTISIVDGFGQAIQLKKTHESDEVKWMVSGKEKKDPYGRVIEAYLPTTQSYPVNYNLLSSADLEYNTSVSSVTPLITTYDIRDRQKTIKQPGESNSTTIDYFIEEGMFGQLITNELNQTQKTFTDIRGRQRKIVQNDEITTQFKYNAINELIEVKNNQGYVTKNYYDLSGRRIRIEHPDQGVTNFVYDKAGNLTERITSNLILGNQDPIHYYYTFNRLDSIYYPVNPSNNVKYLYGNPGDPTVEANNAIGRLYMQEDASGVQAFGYDKMGNLTKNVRSVVVPGRQSYWFFTKWRYDSWNRVMDIFYPDQDKVKYFYNKAGNVEKVTTSVTSFNDEMNLVNSITYTDYGERESIEYANGAVTEYTYDTRRRMQTVEHQFTGFEIEKQYGYDALSNITSIATLSPTGSLPDTGQIGGPVHHTYTYDNFNRLVSATGNYTGPGDLTIPYLKQVYELEMEYDLSHNIISKNQLHIQGELNGTGGMINPLAVFKTSYNLDYSNYATGTYVADGFGYVQPHAPRMIIETPTGQDGCCDEGDPRIKKKLVTYDANGNQLEITEVVGEDEIIVLKNLWDEENRLRAVDLNPDNEEHHNIAVYTYDASGQRILRHIPTRVDVYSNATLPAQKERDVTMIYPSGLITAKVINPDSWDSEPGPVTLPRLLRYTKHYYIGTERISSVTDTKSNLGHFIENLSYNDFFPVSTLRAMSNAQVEAAGEALEETYDHFGLEYSVPTPVVEGSKPTPGYTDFNNASIGRYFFHPDHLGSSSYITDKAGVVSQHMEYLPFGELLVDEHLNSHNSPFKFNAKELDPETGNYYYGARYYNPKWSIWLSVDPLAEKGPQYSPYNYCFNNPINLTDPDGRWPNPPFGFRLGFNLGLGSNGLNFNLTASAGIEHRTPNFQAVAFASASVYGGQQLGTSSMTRGLQFDVTVGAYASIGTGTGSAHKFYTLNSNTASPFNNTFDASFSYGQARTFNSAINASGDGPGWQTQGIVGARFGENFSLSSNNDANSYGTGFTNRLLGDNNTDAGWTGGIVLNIGGVEAGYQNFSGYWSEFGSEGTGFGHSFSAENRLGGNGAYHQSLNRAFNFVRKGNFSGGVFSGAWLQNFIHKNISDDGTYIYNNQGNINTTVGQ